MAKFSLQNRTGMDVFVKDKRPLSSARWHDAVGKTDGDHISCHQ